MINDLLSAQAGGDLMQVQVVPELLHFQLHKLRPHQQVAIEALTGVTEAGAGLQLGRAAAAIVLLTVHTNMLTERQTGGERDRLEVYLLFYRFLHLTARLVFNYL